MIRHPWLASIIIISGFTTIGSVTLAQGPMGQGMGGPGGGPGGGRGPSGGNPGNQIGTQFQSWFDELNKAFVVDDREKMRSLIVQMRKQLRSSGHRSDRSRAGATPSGPQGSPNGPGAPVMPNRSVTFNPLARDVIEKKALTVIQSLPESRQIGRPLRFLLETRGAQEVMVLGKDYSAINLWLCLALKQTKGHLLLWPDPSKIIQQRFDQADVNDLIIAAPEAMPPEKLANVCPELDALVIHSNHGLDTADLNRFIEKIKPGGLVIFDTSSPRLIKELAPITSDPDYSTMTLPGSDRNPLGIALKKR